MPSEAAIPARVDAVIADAIDSPDITTVHTKLFKMLI
jgi:hypothetical protein